MNPSLYHLAQLNIAELKYPADSPELADFVANIDRINQIAESHEGFVWRLLEDSHQVFDPSVYLVNLSIWKSMEALKEFTYQTAHVEIMRRRKEWFEDMTSNSLVLWWVPSGHKPSVKEAKAKLELLDQSGPGPEAFSFQTFFPSPIG